MSRRVVWVEHRGYGCETGCCGHAVRVEDEQGEREVAFALMDHPAGEDPVTFARELVTDELGAEHVADLDWERCVIIDDF